jgi:hypothetical protein
MLSQRGVARVRIAYPDARPGPQARYTLRLGFSLATYARIISDGLKTKAAASAEVRLC